MAEDPRVARSRAAVIQTTLALIAEVGLEGTTVDAITERSGVAKTTIYRHWGGRRELVLDALATVITTPADPDTGSLREDLVHLLTGFVRSLSTGPMAALLTTMMSEAERDPEVADVHRRESERRHHVVRDAVVRGIGRRELPAGTDPDEVVALLAGPVVYRRLVAHVDVGADLVGAIVDRVLRAYANGPERP